MIGVVSLRGEHEPSKESKAQTALFVETHCETPLEKAPFCIQRNHPVVRSSVWVQSHRRGLIILQKLQPSHVKYHNQLTLVSRLRVQKIARVIVHVCVIQLD